MAVAVPTAELSERHDDRSHNGTIIVRDDSRSDRDPKKRRLRYSDPGVTSSQTSTQRRKSTATPSTQLSSRRKSTGTSRANRRHTLAAPPQQRPQMRDIAQGVSKEIQFIPLRQALSARTRRALRRNHLSEEMNDIDEERRALQRKNREELARVRAELERGRQLIEELQKQLHAARIAPPSENGSIGPGSVGMAPIYEDDAEEALSPPVFGSSSTPRTPFRFNMGSALTPALRRFQNENQRENGETPISRRDKKIKALEFQIDQLRQDIIDREEEEKKRAEEEEIYHEAEEQILLEAMDTSQADMSSVTPRDISSSQTREGTITPRTTRSKTKVSFVEEPEEEDFPPMLPADGDDYDDDFGVSVGDDTYDVGEITVQSTPATEVIHEEAITVTTISAFPQVDQENETLKASIEVLKQRVEELEATLENSTTRPEACTFGIQTDPVVDAEKVKLKEMIEMLEDKADVLEQSSLEERNRLWQKIRGHISEAHNYEGVEELDMAIDEILTNLALAQNTADEHHKAFERVDRDLKVERMLAEEKTSEIVELLAERDSLLEQVDKLEGIRSELEGQMADHEADEQRLEHELEDQRRVLTAEQQVLDQKSNELEAVIAEAEKLERDLAELGDVIDEEIAEFPDAAQAPSTTILEKLNAYAEVVKWERETQKAKLEELTDSIADKEDLLEELRGRLASLNTKYEELAKISEQQQALLGNKEQEIQGLKEELASYREELEETKKTNDMLNGVIATKNEKLTSLTDQLTWLTTDLAKIKEKREEAQKEIVELSAELEKKTEEARAQGIRLDLDLSGKNQMITSLEIQLAAMSEQLSSLNDKYSAKKQEILQLSDELIRTKEDAEAKLDELNDELDTKSGKISELQDGMDSLTEQVTDLKTTIEQLNDEQESREAKIEELSDLVNQKQQAITELQALHTVIELKDKTIAEMEAQVGEYGAHLSEKTQFLSSAAAELAAIREEAAGKDESINSLKVEIASLQGELGALQEELESLKDNENIFNATLANRDERMGELSEEINGLNNNIAEKSYEVEELRAEVSSMTSTITEREEQIRALQAEIGELNDRLEARVAQIQKLDEDISALQDANEEKGLSIEELNGTITTLNRTIAERDDTIVTLHRDVSDRNGVIQVNSGTIKMLTGKVGDFEKLVAARDELISSLNEDISQLNQQIDSLNDNLSSIEEQRVSADGKLKEMMEDVAQKDEKIAELEKLYDVIAVQNNKIDSLNDTIDDLRSQLSDLNERYSVAEAKIEELVEEVSRKQHTIQQLEADLDSSILRENEASKRYTDAITVQDGLKDQLEKMQSVVEELKAVVEDREVALEEKDTEIFNLQQQYTDLETAMRERIATHSEQLTALRKELEEERQEAVTALQLKLQEALNDKAELEEDIQATMSEYKERVADLESTIEILEQNLEGSKTETEDVVVHMQSLESAKNAIIAQLEEKIKSVVQAKELDDAAFEEQIEQKRIALAEKEKELADVELASQKDKHAMRIELNKQYEEISRLEEKIEELDKQLDESVEEENRLDEEIQEYEQTVQLLKEDAAKIKASLESSNEELSKEIDALRLDLLMARDELKQEIEAHASSIKDRDATVTTLNDLVGDYQQEGIVLKKRISALKVSNKRLKHDYNCAIEDASAELDAMQNNMWRMASQAKDRKAEYLQRSNARMLAQEEEEEENDEHEDEQLQIEGTAHEGASTAGGLTSPDATTNVSFASPPTPESSQLFAPLTSRIMSLTQTHSKKRRFDSGIGVEEDEDEESTRFEEYGSHRRGFLTEGH